MIQQTLYVHVGPFNKEPCSITTTTNSLETTLTWVTLLGHKNYLVGKTGPELFIPRKDGVSDGQ